MLRTVYTPSSNTINVSIPDKYIGTKLEILVFPMDEVSLSGAVVETPDVDVSFGGWADMDKTTEDICAEIKSSRNFRNKDLAL
jgi:hypothetical protein